jgi:hypothetical protein
MADPIADGFVANLARPEGNITGLTFRPPELQGKRLQLLKEALLSVARIALLVDSRGFRHHHEGGSTRRARRRRDDVVRQPSTAGRARAEGSSSDDVRRPMGRASETGRPSRRATEEVRLLQRADQVIE